MTLSLTLASYYSRLSRPMSITRSIVQVLFFVVFTGSSLRLSTFSEAAITHLPGFDGQLPFHLETGYVAVDEVSQVELFYYFVESERNPSEDPLILWLTGGPGCSSLYGLVREIGPIRFKISPYDGILPTLVSNPYTWTRISNIIFLDWPGMSGFSLVENVKGYIGDDHKSLKEIFNFLKQWFLDHPHFMSNPFYVGGNSYGGKLVPILTHKIIEGNDAGQYPLINLKGYISGNPVTSAWIDGSSRLSYAHGVGILSDELVEAVQRSCLGEDYRDPKSGPCIEQIEIFRDFLNELMLDNFLTPKCEGESSVDPLYPDPEPFRSILERKLAELHAPPSIPDIKCTTYASYLCYHWANDNGTRSSLRVKEGTVKEWQICNPDLVYNMRLIHSSIPYHFDVINRGYRALIFSGDHDVVIPYTGTLAWLESFNLSVVEPWRSWRVNGQVGGYTVKYSKDVTFATVKGGGHEPSKDRNRETSTIFYRWISHKPL